MLRRSAPRARAAGARRAALVLLALLATPAALFAQTDVRRSAPAPLLATPAPCRRRAAARRLR